MNASRQSFGLVALIGSVFLASITAAAAPADRAEPLPDELEGIGITEHLNNPLPLDLEFKDEDGHPVKLADYFQPGRPVILTLNYFRCPMLCSLQLNGLIDALREMEWVPGQEFEIVTVSFDPRENPTLAKLKKENYMKDYGRPSAAAGWHFLTGPKASSEPLAGAVGFRYRWNEDSKQWMHAAAAYVCTPQGRISRYLYGVTYDPKTLRLSLVEASAGKIGSTIDQIILFCYHYDAGAGEYAPAAMNLMRAGGGITVIALGTLLMVLWRRGARRKAAAAEPPPT